MQSFIRSLALILLLAGCKSYKTKYPYSLSGFNPELRLRLELIVQNGGMCYVDLDSPDEYRPGDYEYFSKKISSADLRKLIDCEHPILRFLGFSHSKGKKDSDLSQILLNHLDDTAIITTCNGEFGPGYITVSDALIRSSRRDSVILKSILIDAVLTKHRYLNHAYEFIDEMEKPDIKYYSVIKKMASINGSALYYDDLYAKKEIALYALSKYKSKEDIPFISDQISKYWKSFSGYRNYCFIIIQENPDTAYFKIIEDYYRRISGERTKQNLQLGFYDSYSKLGEKYNSFLSALVSFKNKRSSQMIDTIIKGKLYPDNTYFSFSFEHSENYPAAIYNLLKENECPEYQRLIKLLEPAAMAYAKQKGKEYSQGVKFEPTPANIDEYDDRYW